MKEKSRMESMIYEIRGKQVMLDSDLARIYECANGTKDINKAVNRNVERFPEGFYFQLTAEEFNNLKFQIGTSSWNGYGGIRKLPHVFTEQGVVMLSSVLRNSKASIVSINIMRAFVSMRKYISNNLIEQKYINELVLKDNRRIDLLEETFNSFKEKNNHIFFEGQIYDAYSLLIDILNKCIKNIIIIDNYAGKELLDMLKNINNSITIISKNFSNELILKYNKQYKNISFVNNNSFHDRFIIIDEKILYHCGSSFKDIGNKCFAINRIDDIDLLNNLIKNLCNNNNLLTFLDKSI